MKIYIYEVIDATDDEMYFPMGIFSSKEGARIALKLAADDQEHAITDHGGDGDYEVIKVLERSLNCIDSSHGRTVYVMTREHAYQEVTDLCLWETTYQGPPIKKPSHAGQYRRMI